MLFWTALCATQACILLRHGDAPKIRPLWGCPLCKLIPLFILSFLPLCFYSYLGPLLNAFSYLSSWYDTTGPVLQLFSLTKPNVKVSQQSLWITTVELMQLKATHASYCNSHNLMLTMLLTSLNSFTSVSKPMCLQMSLFYWGSSSSFSSPRIIEAAICNAWYKWAHNSTKAAVRKNRTCLRCSTNVCNAKSYYQLSQFYSKMPIW